MTESHQSIQELIPWYLNGTLAEENLDRIKSHLETCDLCAELLETELIVSQRMQDSPADLLALMDKKEIYFQQLQFRIAGAKQPRIRQFSTAQLAASVLLATTLGWLFGQLPDSAAYATLTGSTTGLNVMQVVFSPQASEREIRQLLLDGSGSLISGPSPQGVYRVQYPAHINARAYASRLEQHPATLFVELELD